MSQYALKLATDTTLLESMKIHAMSVHSNLMSIKLCLYEAICQISALNLRKYGVKLIGSGRKPVTVM